MTTSLTILFGGGGHAKVVVEAARAQRPEIELVVLDDFPKDASFRLLDLPYSGGREWLTPERAATARLMPAIGDNAARGALLAWARSMGVALANVQHPSAVLSPSATIGGGVFLAPGAIVNAQTRLADGVIVNTGASVDHDCDLGEAAHIAPGVRLCGNVTVGARTLIGVGAAVVPGVTIGADVLIGAGMVVTRDVADGERLSGSQRPLVK